MPNNVNPIYPGLGPVKFQPIQDRLSVEGEKLNSYDFNYRPERIQEHDRADNQAWYDQMVKGITRSTISILPKIGSIAGGVYGGIKAIATQDMSAITDNTLMNYMSTIEDKLKEAIPIYQTRKYAESGLLGKMLTTSMWSVDALDAVAYTVASGVTGTIFGAASKALRLGDLVRKGFGAAATAERLHKAGLVAMTTYNAIGEASGEAHSIYKEILKDLDERADLTPEKKEQIASQAAKETFAFNVATLALPNYIENTWFHGTWSDQSKNIRDLIWKGKGAGDIKDFISLKKEVLGSMASEGLYEENFQTAIEEYERAFAKGETNEGFIEGFTNNVATNIKGFIKSFIPGVTTSAREDRGALAIGIGKIIGGAGGARSFTQQAKQYKSTVETEKTRYDDLFKEGGIGDNAFDFFIDEVGSIFKRGKDKEVTAADGKKVLAPSYELDDSGNPIQSDEAVLKKMNAELRNRKLFDMQMIAAYKNSPALAEFHKNRSLAAYAYQLASKGYSGEEIDMYLSELDKANHEAAKQLGITTYVTENHETVKQYIDTLQKNSDLLRDSKEFDKDPVRARFQIFAMKSKFFLDTKIDALEKAKKTATDTGLETIDKMIEDASAMSKALVEDKENVFKEYKEKIFDVHMLVKELKDLDGKRTAGKALTKEESDRLDELEYTLTEEQYANGEYVFNHDASNGLTTHVPSVVTTKVRPGRLDDEAFKIGQTILAFEDARNQSEAGESPKSIADNLLRNATFNPSGESDDTISKVSDNLLDEASAQHEVFAEWAQAEDEMKELYMDGESDVSSPLIQGLVERDEHGAITAASLSAIEKVVEDNRLKAKNAVQDAFYMNHLHSKLNELRNNRAKPRNLLDRKLVDKEFLENFAIEPTKAFIKAFKADPDNFEEDTKAAGIIDGLRKAKMVWAKRGGNTEVDALLDEMENTIFPAIRTNVEARIKKLIEDSNDKIQASLETLLSFEPIRSNKEIKSAIEQVLSEEVFSPESYELIVNAVKSQVDKDALGNLLNAEMGKLGAEFWKIPQVAKGGNVSLEEFFQNSRQYFNNPNKFFHKTIQTIFASKWTNQDSSIFRYSIDLDIAGLLRFSKGDSTLSTEEKQVIEKLVYLHTKGLALFNIKLRLESKVDIKTVIDDKSIIDADLIPTLQQKRVIFTALHRMLSPIKSSFSDNEHFTIVRGLPGSGKSTVVGKYIYKVLKTIFKQKVYAFSRYEHSSNNINKILEPLNPPTNTFEKLLAMPIEEFAKLDTLIVDEIFTFTNADIQKLNMKLAEVHKTKKKTIKVLALGDHSQTMAEPSTDGSNINSFLFSLALDTDVLSASFRTNVGAISSFIKSFQLKVAPVLNVSAQASTNVESFVKDPANTNGVIAVSEDELFSALNTPSARSRVLIVANETEKSRFRSRTKVPIFTVGEAQGVQWDEVYTILPLELLGEKAIDVNRGLYTAYSRAKQLVVTTNVNVRNSKEDASMGKSISQAATEIAENEIIHKESLSTYEAIKKKLGAVGKVSPDPIVANPVTEPEIKANTTVPPADAIAEAEATKPTEDDELDDVIEDDTDKTQTNTVRITSEDDANVGDYSISYPTNYGLVTKKGEEPLVIPGAPVHVIRAEKEIGTKKTHYVLVTKGTNGRYIVVGEIGKNDLTSPNIISNRFKTMSESKPGVAISKEKLFSKRGIDKFILTDEVVHELSLGTFYLVEATPMKPIYSKTQHSSPTLLDQLVATWHEGWTTGPNGAYYPLEGSSNWIDWEQTLEGDADGQVDWKGLKGRVRAVIFTKNSKDPRYVIPATADNIREGFAYLEITDPKFKGSNLAEAKNFYIPLQPKGIHIDSWEVQALRKYVRSVLDLVDQDNGIIKDDPILAAATAKAFNMEHDETRQWFHGFVQGNRERDGMFEAARVSNNVMDKDLVVQLKEETKEEAMQEIMDRLLLANPNLTEEQLSHANEIMTKLEDVAKSVWGGEYTTRFVLDEEQAKAMVGTVENGYKIIAYEAVKEGKTRIKYIFRYETDGDQAGVLKTTVLRKGKGPAQIALNSIAAANATYDAVPIRHTKKLSESGKIVASVVHARNIQGYNAVEPDGTMHYDGHVDFDGFKNEIAELYPQLKNLPEMEFLTQGEMVEFLKEEGVDRATIFKTLDKHAIKPLSILTLYKAVADEMFGEDGVHIGEGDLYLRRPLKIGNTRGDKHILKYGEDFNATGSDLSIEENRNKINEDVTSPFVGVQRTTVTLALNPIEKETTPEVATVVLPKAAPETRTINLREAKISKTLQKITEVLGEESVSVITTLGNEKDTKVLFTQTKDLAIHSNFFLDPTNEVDMYHLVHEMIHARTIRAIDSVEKGTATPEEKLFYDRLKYLQEEYDAYLKKKKIAKEDGYQTTKSELTVKEFVASLANPKFIKHAKAARIKKNSILDEIIAAITDLLFGDKKDSDIYTLTLETLDQYLNDKAVIAPEVIEDTIETKITRFKNYLILQELEDEYDEAEYKSYIKDGEFTDTWNKLDGRKQVEIIEAALAPPSGSSEIDRSYAIYEESPRTYFATPGAIVSDDYLPTSLKQRLKEEAMEDEMVVNILNGILSAQLFDDSLDIIYKLSRAYKTKGLEGFVKAVVNNQFIFSKSDRYKVKTDAKLAKPNNAAIVKAILSEEEDKPDNLIALENGLAAAAKVLIKHESLLRKEAGVAETEKSTRYEAARNVVVDAIINNKRRASHRKKGIENDELILTKQEVVEELIASLSTGERQLEANKAVGKARRAMFAEIKTLKELDPKDKSFKEKHTAQERNVEIAKEAMHVAQSKYIGINALLQVNAKTGKKIIFDVLDDINPKNTYADNMSISSVMNVDEENEDILAETDADAREDRELNAASISEYVKKQNKSTELTATDSIKDFISLVTVSNEAGTREKIINPSYVYIKSLMFFVNSNIELGTSESLIPSLLQDIQIMLDTPSLNRTDRAIYQNIYDLVVAASSNIYRERAMPSNITMESQMENGRPLYRVTVGNKISPLFGRTKDMFTFINKYSEKQISIGMFNKLFEKHEAQNALREIHATMISMRETELYVGTVSYSGGYNIAYIKSKASGAHESVKASVKSKISDIYMANDNSIVVYRRNFLKRFANSDPNKASSNAEKISAIKAFYGDMGLMNEAINTSFTDEVVKDLFQSVVNFLEKAAEAESNIDRKTMSEAEALHLLHSNLENYYNKITDGVKASSEYMRNPSVLDADGNRYYKIHESSHMYDMIRAFEKGSPNSTFEGATGRSKKFKFNEIVKCDLLRANIFTLGINKIYEVGEHAGTKNKDTLTSTSFQREKRFQYFQREMLLQFMDGARQFSNQYYQSFYTPSDKPKNPTVKIQILADTNESLVQKIGTDGYPIELTDEEKALKANKHTINRALNVIFDQLVDKRDVQLDIKNYNRRTKEYPGFKILLQIEKELGKQLSKDPAVKQEFMDALNKKWDEEAMVLADALVTSGFKLDQANTIPTLHSLADHMDKSDPLVAKALSRASTARYYNIKKDDTSTQAKNDHKEIVYVIAKMYVKNHHVNSYSLFQLMGGDEAAFDNSEDVVKRMSGMLAPGVRGLVDSYFGMSTKTKALILTGELTSKEDSRSRIQEALYGNRELTPAETAELDGIISTFGKPFDAADGEGFMLPSRAQEIKKGLGRGWNTGNVMKPVYYSLQEYTATRPDGSTYTTSIPLYLKFSSVVLTDDVVSRFPTLKTLRDNLIRTGASEILMNSAVKVGERLLRDPAGNEHAGFTMKEFLALTPEELGNIQNFQSSPIYELDNASYRFQHNPASDPRKSIALYSQLLYFLNSYESTYHEADIAYKMVANLVRMGREEVVEAWSDNEGKLSVDKLSTYLKNKFKGPGSERALDMFINRINLDFPLIEKKSVTAIASTLQEKSISIRFSGSKLVLQTSEGIYKYQDESLFGNISDKASELSFTTEYVKDANGNMVKTLVAEVIVPEALLSPRQIENIKKGVPTFLYGDSLGFRIPTSELHSATALRVVGIYTNELTNVVIGPKELVPIQGVDFDVDAMFLITREVTSDKHLRLFKTSLYKEYLEYRVAQQAKIKEAVENGVPGNERSVEFWNEYITSSTLSTDSADLRFSVIKHMYDSSENKSTFLQDYGIDGRGINMRIVDPILHDMLLMKFMLEKYGEEIGEEVPSFLGQEYIRSNAIVQEEGLPIGYELTPYEVNGEQHELYILVENAYDIKTIEADIKERTTLFEEYGIHKGVLRSYKTSYKDLYKSYAKNSLTESVLRIITDEAQNKRMLSAISFNKLNDALDLAVEYRASKEVSGNAEDRKERIRELANKYKEDTLGDLGSPLEKFKSFLRLTDGAVLTGAFANALKVVSYVSRGGIDMDSITDLFTAYDVNTAKGRNTIQKEIGKIIQSESKRTQFRKDTYTAGINPRYKFTFNGITYDTIRNMDINGANSVSEILDSLLNAAIDNLKLSLLHKLHVNTLTGSATIGLISMGMPINDVINILQSDLFKPLLTGEVSSINAWIREKKEEFKASNENGDVIVKTSDIHLGTEQAQLKLLRLFERANKVGEDIRNLAVFQDVIRQLDVTVNDLDATFARFSSKIGRIANISKFQSKETFAVFVPRSDFSIISPMLFEYNPHILEAVRTAQYMSDTINKTFLVHSQPVRDFIRKLHLGDTIRKTDDYDNTNAINTAARRSLVRYILSSLLYEELDTTIPQKKTYMYRDKTGKAQKKTILLSKARSFSEQVTDDIYALKGYVSRYNQANPDSPITNRFLDLIYKAYNVSSKTYELRFSGGVNLNAIDFEQISKGFLDLARFYKKEDNLEYGSPNRSIADIQKNLITYAVINYGLEFSTTGFSSYIPARYYKQLDTELNTRLTKFVESVSKDSPDLSAQHFKLIFHILNHKYLDYIEYALKVPTATTERETKDGGTYTIKQYGGADTNVIVNGIPGRTVFFDAKFKMNLKKGFGTSTVLTEATEEDKEQRTDENINQALVSIQEANRNRRLEEEPEYEQDNEELAEEDRRKYSPEAYTHHPLFIKESFNDNTVVFIRVAEGRDSKGEMHSYYQRIGSVRDMAMKEATGNAYLFAEYFNPFKASLSYFAKEDDSFLSRAFYPAVKVGDTVQIYPDHNLDRTEKIDVKITDIEHVTENKMDSWKYSYEPTEKKTSIGAPVETPTTPEITDYGEVSFAIYEEGSRTYGAEKIAKKWVDQKADDEKGKYTGPLGEFERTGNIIQGMKTKQWQDDGLTPGEREAKRNFKNVTPGTKKLTSDGTMTEEEQAKYIDGKILLGRAKGDLFHLIIHNTITPSEETTSKINTLINTYGFTVGEYEWIMEHALDIVAKTGTDYVTKFEKSWILNPKAIDKIHTEVKIGSEILGIMGTMDMFIDHSNNVYSIYDLKTGSKFNRATEMDMFKYGSTATEDIFDTPRNRAKLQLMWYALLVKIENPDAKFDSLEVLAIRNKYTIFEADSLARVNTQAYLEMLQKYIKNEMPAEYARLEKEVPHFSKLFTHTEYTSNKPVQNRWGTTDPGAVLHLNMMRLQSIMLRHSSLRSGKIDAKELSREEQAEVKQLMSDIIQLKQLPGIDTTAWTNDIQWMDSWLGSASASTNPFIQLYYHALTEQSQKARNEYQLWNAKFKTLLSNLLKSKGITLAARKIGGIDKLDLYKNILIRTTTPSGENILRFILEEEDAVQWNKLTKEEKAFAKFCTESVGRFFDNNKATSIDPVTGERIALANKVVTRGVVNGVESNITNLDLFNRVGTNNPRALPFQYYEGFLPKIAPTAADIQAKHGLLSKEMLAYLKNKYSTNYFEAVYDGWASNTEAIPFRGLGNEHINASGEYSLDVDLIMNTFMQQTFYKQHLDEVYSYAHGIAAYLHLKEDPTLEFTNTRATLEDMVQLHLLNRTSDSESLSSRPIRSSGPGGYKQISFTKVGKSIKSFFRGTTMWLRVDSGIRNAMFAYLYTLKEGVVSDVDSLVSKGLNNNNADFSTADIAKGMAQASSLIIGDQLKKLTGTHKHDNSSENHKIWLLMQKFGYLPDSYDWYVNPNMLLTESNTLFNERTLTLFHSMPEEILSTSIFIAQMKAMKTNDGKNMLDHYQVITEKDKDGIEFTTVKWVGPESLGRGELDTREINNLKYLYERMHGGYRQTERVRAEYYIFGQLFLQLKKFFPSILKNVFASKGLRGAQGKYVMENGKRVWKPEIVEGRIKFIVGMILDYLGVLSKKGDKKSFLNKYLGFDTSETYQWKNLSTDQKRTVRDFVITMGTGLLMLMGFAKHWDDDDESSTKKMAYSILRDYTGQWNPLELAKNTKNLLVPVSFERSWKLMENGSTAFLSTIMYYGFDDESYANKQGDIAAYREVLKQFPVISGLESMNRWLRNQDMEQILPFYDTRVR